MIRVIGLGNEWAGDDAVGLIAAQMVKERLKGIASIEVSSHEVPEWEMFERMQPEDSLVFIDACASGSEPGTVFELHVDERHVDELGGRGMRHCSSHGLGLAHWLSMVEVLGGNTGHVFVFAVELSDTTMGAGLSPAVEGALPALVEKVVGKVAEKSGRNGDA